MEKLTLTQDHKKYIQGANQRYSYEDKKPQL